MKLLDWTNCYNEFTRVQGYTAKSYGLFYKVSPEGNLASLKVIDEYTGALIKIFTLETCNDAISQAESINMKLELGYSLEQLIR